MENRSHALLAGLFTIVLVIAAALGSIWISKKNLPRVPFELIATSPVTGLSVQSEVRYQGVPVGSVEKLRFVPENPGKVLILIAIDPKTPVTSATWAEIVIAGVTGISNVELRDDGSSLTRLSSTESHIVQIPIRPSFLDRLISQTSDMIPAIEGLLKHVNQLASDDNLAALSTTLRNTAALSEQLRHSVDQALGDFRSLTRSAQQSLDRINAPEGALRQVTLTLKDIQASVAQLQTSTLPDVSMLTLSATDTSRALTQAARQFGQSPQSLIFGRPLTAPGPGESGFAGFGAQGR